MKKRTSRSRPSDADGAIVVRSDDGAISFRLRRTQLGLLVHRERRHEQASARLIQTAVFRDPERFLRWCEADSTRFDYPMIFSAVRREGGALFDGDDPGSLPRRDHRGR
jgi:hypothetical protein